MNDQAIVLLLDGPQCYARDNDVDNQNSVDARAGLGQRGQSLGPFGTSHDIRGASCPQSWQLELLGEAVWRQRLLERTGWITIRVHWNDWMEAEAMDDQGRTAHGTSRAAMGKDGDGRKSHRASLLQSLLTRSGVM